MKAKNKTRYLQGILSAIVAAAAVLVGSCVQPDGTALDGAHAGKGTVVLSVSTGSAPGSVLKTILPTGTPVFTRYDLGFTPKGADEPSVTVEVAGVLQDYEVVLDAGDWEVFVIAYQKFGDDDYPAAFGESEEFSVTAGGIATPVTVSIAPIQIGLVREDEDEQAHYDALEGIFTYKVTFPTGASGTLTLGDGEPITLGSGKEVSVPVTHGYYELSVALTKGELSAGIFEVVHIYAGLESKAEFNFTDANFAETVYLAGTLPALPDGVSLTGGALPIKVYSDPAYQNQVATPKNEVSGGKWLVGVPVANVGEPLYIRAEATGGGTTYTLTGGTDEVPEAGEKGIALAYTGISGGSVAADVLAAVIEDVADGEVLLNNITIAKGGDDELDLGAAKVTLAGTSVVENGVTVKAGGEGSFNVAGGAAVSVAGVVDLTETAVEVSGTVTVVNGGTLKVATTDTDDFYGTGGSLVLAQGSTVYVEDIEGDFLGGEGAVYSWDGTGGSLTLAPHSLTLTSGTLVLNQDNGIQSTDTATIAAHAALKVAAGSTFTVEGTLDVAANGNVNVEGTFVTAKDSNGDLKGTVTIVSGGVSKDLNSGGGSLWKDKGSTGKYVFEAGSKAYTEETLVIGDDDAAAIRLAEGATFTNSQTDYTLAGDATIALAQDIEDKAVTINGTLTAAADLTLTGTTTLKGAAGAKIVINKGNTISGAGNFYAQNGEYLLEDITADNGDFTYVWNAGLDNGEGGWKASETDLKPGFEPPEGAIIGISYIKNNARPVTWDDDDTLTLSWKASDTLTVIAARGGASYSWDLDGKAIDGEEGEENEVKLEARKLLASEHSLTVFVTTEGGVEYSRRVTFEVE